MLILFLHMANQKRLNTVILMGGPSAEHEVSLATGKKICETLNKNRFNIKPITIDKDGFWLLPTDYNEKNFRKYKHNQAIDKIKQKWNIDVVFIAMHGTYGEDGTIQKLLDLANIPYTGSKTLSSAIAIDKEMTKKLLIGKSIPLPKHTIITKKDNPKKYLEKISLPLVVKPARQGSSIGVTIIKNKSDFFLALEQAFKYDSKIILEEHIKGREINATVLGNENPTPLPLIEIRPKISDFFDYKAKYQPGGSEEICPAPINKALTKKIQKLALEIHKTLDCRGVTRSEFILNNDTPYFLEINTLPGMTETSLVPQAAAIAGISFPQLLEKLIELALEK